MPIRASITVVLHGAAVAYKANGVLGFRQMDIIIACILAFAIAFEPTPVAIVASVLLLLLGTLPRSNQNREEMKKRPQEPEWHPYD